MDRIEKTVFISYRREDRAWALAIYQYLSNHNYDVFLDYTNISAGDFEQIIISNIKARAHFLVILTPSALERCSEPGDWLRREIETAISKNRNIIPLLIDGFNFDHPSVLENLTGKLKLIQRYQALIVHPEYFDAAMDRLRIKFLDVALDTVLHPLSDEAKKAVEAQKNAANNAILEKKDKSVLPQPIPDPKPTEKFQVEVILKIFLISIIALGFLGGIFWVYSYLQNQPVAPVPTATQLQPAITTTYTPEAFTPVPNTLIPTTLVSTNSVLPTNTPEPFIRITDPVDEGNLTCDNPINQDFCLFTVEGESGGVGSYLDLRMYVFVFPVEPPGAGWYLQKSPAAIESNGNWTQSPSYIGSDGMSASTGDTLNIRAILVTKDATYNDEKLQELVKANNDIVLSAIEDIEGIVALSDIIDLTITR